MAAVVPKGKKTTALFLCFCYADCNVAHRHVCLLEVGVLQYDDFVLGEIELCQVVYDVCFVILDLLNVVIVLHALLLANQIVLLAHNHHSALFVVVEVLRLPDPVNEWVRYHHLLAKVLAN